MRIPAAWTNAIPFSLAAMAFLLGGTAQAQFEQPAESQVRERLIGAVIVGEDAPTPEPGDQIGVFFEDVAVGLFVFTSQQDDPLAYEVLVFGDDPSTNLTEGPGVGDPITVRFFDSSTNSILTNVAVLNDSGEAVNLTFQGDLVPVIPGLPLDLTPTRNFDIRLGQGGGGDGDGDGDGDGGGGGGSPTGDPDVNGDGRIDRKDVALVIRIYISGERGVDSAAISRADVNGDGTVNADDAIAVIRAARDQ